MMIESIRKDRAEAERLENGLKHVWPNLHVRDEMAVRLNRGLPWEAEAAEHMRSYGKPRSYWRQVAADIGQPCQVPDPLSPDEWLALLRVAERVDKEIDRRN